MILLSSLRNELFGFSTESEQAVAQPEAETTGPNGTD